MDIHNTMEDLVLQYLDELLESKKDICKCYRCRIDMACYTLNKVRPMYVVSSRGVIHTENTKKEHIQNEIDVYATVAEAIDVVSNTRRHEVNEKFDEDVEMLDDYLKYYSETGAYYNFPQIVGRIFDSNTITPIKEAKISLYYETGTTMVPMFNKLWQNPIDVVPQTKGTYSFWPAPLSAVKAGVQKDFQMNIKIAKEDYDILHKFFYIRIISTKDLKKFIKKENIFYIDDIFLNPLNSENMEEENTSIKNKTVTYEEQ